MRNKRRVLALSVATLTVLAMAWSAGGNTQANPQTGAAAQPAAQQAPPERISVAVTQVKPDMLTTWQDLIRNEAVPALKKAGVPWRWVWTNTPAGGQGFTFVTVTPIANYAQFDQGSPLQKALGTEGLARYNAKVRPTIVSTHTTIQTLVRNASIQSFSSTPPNLAIVTTIQLLPGKGQEFASITASEFVPAMKKSGVVDYWVFATNFGGPGGQRTIVTPIANFAALDAPNPLTRALGAEGAQKLNQKRGALVASTETIVVRYVPELSFGVPTAPKAPTP